MYKRYVVVIMLLSFLMFLLSFTGCSITNKEKNVESMTGLNSLKGVTLHFCFPYLLQTGQKAGTTAVLDEIQKRVGIKLDFQWFESREYLNKIRNLDAADMPIDAFSCGDPHTGYYGFNELAKAGKLKDITLLLPECAPNICNYLSSQDLDAVTIDGKVVAVPSIFPASYGNFAVVRDDLAKKYGIQTMETYDDYENYLKIIKEREPGIIPGYVMSSINDIITGAYDYAILDKVDGTLVYKWNNTDGKLIPLEKVPEFKDVFNRLSRWNSKGYLDKPDGSQDPFDSCKEKIVNGQLASYIIPQWRFWNGETFATLEYELNNLLALNSGTNKNIKIYLLYPEKKRQRINSAENVFTSGCIAFNAASKNVEHALTFLNWVQQDQENYDLLMYGIKDKDYILISDQYSLPQGMTDNDTYLDWSGRNVFKNVNFERYPSGTPKNSKQMYMGFIDKNTQYATYEGFYADVTSIQGELNQRSEIFLNKILAPIGNGSLRSEEIDTVIKELEDCGTDNIVKVLQEQLDKWKTENHK